MVMIIDGGYPECEKCKAQNTIEYKNGRRICSICGTDQLDHKRQKMISNLRVYGFVEIKNYEKPTFFQKLFKIKTKQLESHYRYMSIIAKHINNSSNMTLLIGDEKINFNFYGSFKYVKKRLDGIIYDKIRQRRLKLEKIEKIKEKFN